MTAHWSAETAWPWLQQCLPEPIRVHHVHNGKVVLAGEPPSVVLRINAAAMRVGVFTARHWGDLAALADEPIASLTWIKLPADETACQTAVRHLVDAASTIHAARLTEQTHRINAPNKRTE